VTYQLTAYKDAVSCLSWLTQTTLSFLNWPQMSVICLSVDSQDRQTFTLVQLTPSGSTTRSSTLLMTRRPQLVTLAPNPRPKTPLNVIFSFRFRRFRCGYLSTNCILVSPCIFTIHKTPTKLTSLLFSLFINRPRRKFWAYFDEFLRILLRFYVYFKYWICKSL
jgi:hypothetical protein